MSISTSTRTSGLEPLTGTSRPAMRTRKSGLSVVVIESLRVGGPCGEHLRAARSGIHARDGPTLSCRRNPRIAGIVERERPGHAVAAQSFAQAVLDAVAHIGVAERKRPPEADVARLAVYLRVQMVVGADAGVAR